MGGQEYYEPLPSIACSKCKMDAASFPGADFDGPRPVPESVREHLLSEVRANRPVPGGAE